MYGNENRLSLSTTGLPGVTSTSSMMGSMSLLRSSADSALTETAANRRQQMLRYSASRRLSLRPPTNLKGKVRFSFPVVCYCFCECDRFECLLEKKKCTP